MSARKVSAKAIDGDGGGGVVAWTVVIELMMSLSSLSSE